MNRSIPRTLLSALALMALAALTLVGCASSGASASAPADVSTAPAAPAKKPFEAPTWDAAVYSNDELGFSVHYPSDFAEQPAQGDGLFSAASPAMVPRLDINRAEATPGTTLPSIVPVLADTLGQIGGGEATVRESKETKLQDGVTPAIEVVLDWTFQGFPLQSLIVGAIEKGAVITVMVTGMQGGDLAELGDVAYTLYFDE